MEKNTPMTFEQFADIMNFIYESEQATCALDNVYSNYRHIFGDAEAPVPVYVDKLIRLLECIFNLKEDPDGNTTISWWVYDCKCGEDLDMVQSMEILDLPEDHKYRNPDLSSVRKLYDFLCWESANPVEN